MFKSNQESQEPQFLGAHFETPQKGLVFRGQMLSTSCKSGQFQVSHLGHTKMEAPQITSHFENRSPGLKLCKAQGDRKLKAITCKNCSNDLKELSRPRNVRTSEMDFLGLLMPGREPQVLVRSQESPLSSGKRLQLLAFRAQQYFRTAMPSSIEGQALAQARILPCPGHGALVFLGRGNSKATRSLRKHFPGRLTGKNKTKPTATV